MKVLYYALSVVLLLTGTLGQTCPNNLNVVVFGDGISAGTAGSLVYGPGRDSNGPVWPEILSPRTLRNQAVPGAVAYQPANPAATSLATQMNNYLNANGNFNPAQTLIFWIGANDLFNLLGNQPTNAAAVSTAISNIQNSIWASVNTAISRGARNILILSPIWGGLYPRSTSNQDALTAATQQFNTQLQTSVNTFTGAPSGTRVNYIDGAAAANTWLTQTTAQGWLRGPCQAAPVFGTAYNCVSPTTYQWFSSGGMTTNSQQVMSQLLKQQICIFATGTRTPTPIPRPSPSPIPRASPIASPINRGGDGDGSDEGLLGLLGLLALPFCLCALYIPLLCLPLIMKKKKGGVPCCPGADMSMPMAAPEMYYVEAPAAPMGMPYGGCPMNSPVMMMG